MDSFPVILPRSVVTLAVWRWANVMVATRSFTFGLDGEPEIAMIPLMDAFNHRPGSTLRQFIDGEMRLVATETIEQGSEVFNTYSFLDNVGLFSNYGFVLAPNVVDSIRGSLNMRSLLTAANPLPGVLKQRLATLASPSRIFAAIGPDLPTLTFVQVASLRELPLGFSAAHYLKLNATSMLNALSTLCHSRCYDVAMKMLGDICRDKLDALPTSVERDQEMLSRSADRAERTALTFRIQTKLVLHHCVSVSQGGLPRWATPTFFNVAEAFAHGWLGQWAQARWRKHGEHEHGPEIGSGHAVQITRLMLATSRFRDHLEEAGAASILNRLVRRHIALFNPHGLKAIIHTEPAAVVLVQEALKMVSSGDGHGVQLALRVALAIEPTLRVAERLSQLTARPGWRLALQQRLGPTGTFRCDMPPSLAALATAGS